MIRYRLNVMASAACLGLFFLMSCGQVSCYSSASNSCLQREGHSLQATVSYGSDRTALEILQLFFDMVAATTVFGVDIAYSFY